MPYTPRNTERRILQEVRKRYGINAQQSPKKKRTPVQATVESNSNTPAEPPQHPRERRTVSPQPRRKRRWLRRAVLLTLITVVALGGVFGYRILAASNKITVAERSIIGQLKDLLFAQGEFLQGEQEGRINILLLAIGGEGHKGENLADTIIVASISPHNNKAALLSIPRDLYVQVPDEEFYSKINAVHAYGESRKQDAGPKLLQQKVEEITGLPLHYYARVDFTAFKSIVDAVGGVDITIENSFYDYWHKISFPAGTERMNGERALAYVRARYIEGPEGGDFKRAARQQQVLLALRKKVFSVQTAFDFTSLSTILNSLSDNIRTDMQLWELKRLFEITRTIDTENISHTVLTTGPKGVLVGSTEVLGGSPAAVLRTRTGDFSEIQSIAANLLEQSLESQPSPAPETAETESQPEEAPQETPETQQEEPSPEPLPLPTVEVRNGTSITGLAKRTADNLEEKDYTISTIGNAATQSVTSTTVYVLNEEQTDNAKKLAETLSAQTNSGLPDEEQASTADVLIILGEDANDQ